MVGELNVQLNDDFIGNVEIGDAFERSELVEDFKYVIQLLRTFNLQL